MSAMIINAHINQETSPPQSIAEHEVSSEPPETGIVAGLSITSTTSRRRGFGGIAGKSREAFVFFYTAKS